MAIKNVALLGADGTLGPFVYRSLVENGFNVTVLKRASSKSTSAFPSEIKVPDDFPSDSLIDTLRGKDAVVVTIKGSEAAIQKRLADACVKAGVRRKSYLSRSVSGWEFKLMIYKICRLYSSRLRIRRFI